MSTGAQSSLKGRTLGNRYALEYVLGTGAMGTVYAARQIATGMAVAVKVLHPRLATDAGLVQRFECEAFATSRFDHPNALRVLDFGEDRGLRYLVTEYVEAEDLLAIMEAEWPLSEERIVGILSQVLSALIAVHEIGIVHRDLKPENILVLAGQNDDGTKSDVIKICDFGIAKISRPELAGARPFAHRLTAEGLVVGTPEYMSPEQARGQAVDGRSDLYAVGVVLYYLLAGRTPFTADDPVGIALKHVSEAPVPPSHYRDVHPALEAICLRALSKRPEDRFQTAGEMKKALGGALTGGAMAALVLRATPSLRVGAIFSTLSPVMVAWRQSIVRFASRQNQGRRARFAFGYAAAIFVATITASAFVASRRSSAIDPMVQRMHAGTALVSPPRLAVEPPPSLTPDEMGETEKAPTREPPGSDLARRIVARPRRVSPSQSPPDRPIVVTAPPATPIIPVAPAPTDSALLVRSDPWSSRAGSPSSPASTVSLPPRTAEQKPSPAAPTARRESGPSASFDRGRASVGFSNIVTSAGISGPKVKTALSHVPLLACYEQALRSRTSDAPLETELRLAIDMGGRVVGATLAKDGNLTGLRGCIESAARGARVRDVDTGDGSATVQLMFSPR